MENLLEKISFVDEEITLQEDSTTSSSSLATVLSEEDDLRLGEEANSFILDKNVGCTKLKAKSRQPEYFVVKRHHTEPEYQMSGRYSTISSIKDLLDARDPDAEEVLFNLGFASNNGQESRESILSRFSTPEHESLLDPLQYQQQGASSLTKTREWLEKHDGDSELSSYLKSKDSKSRQTSSTSSIEVSGTFLSKRQMSRSKALRKKWSSKSRQSSFDRLPNLKEEDPIAEERKSLSGPEILTRGNTSPNILNKKASAFNNVMSIKNDRNYIDSGQGYGVISLNKIKGSGNGGGNSLKLFENNKSVLQQKVSNTILPGNQLQHTLMKNLKSGELMEAQTDSFELEEIMSSNGHVEESTNKMPTNKSAVADNRRRRQGVVANPFNLNVAATPTSMISEASSGFCEPLDHPTKYKTILPIVSQSETGGNVNTQRSFVNAMAKKFHGNFKTIESLENEFKSYCGNTAKIICASATAKAAIKLKQDNTLSLKYSINASCKNLNVFSTLLDRKSKHCEKRKVLSSTLYRCYSTETLKFSKCSRHRQPKYSFSYNPNTRVNPHIPKLTRFHSLPQLNFPLMEPFEKEGASLMSSISEVSMSAQSTSHKHGHSSQSLKDRKQIMKNQVLQCTEDKRKNTTNITEQLQTWKNLDFKTEQCSECHKNFNLSLENKEENKHLPELLKPDGNNINNNFVVTGDMERISGDMARIKELNLLKDTFPNHYKIKQEDDKLEKTVSSSLLEKLSSGTDMAHLFPIKDLSAAVNGHS